MSQLNWKIGYLKQELEDTTLDHCWKHWKRFELIHEIEDLIEIQMGM